MVNYKRPKFPNDVPGHPYQPAKFPAGRCDFCGKKENAKTHQKSSWSIRPPVDAAHLGIEAI